MRLWPDGVGIVRKQGGSTLRPVRVSRTSVWPFPEQGLAVTPPALTVELGPVTAAPKETDALVSSIRKVVHTLRTAGRMVATLQEVVAIVRVSERRSFTERQVGLATSSLALGSRGTRDHGTRIRVYAPRSCESNHGRGVPIRSARPDFTAAEDIVGPEIGTADSSRGDNHSGPTDPVVPTE
jgi:hypothetical protein